MAGVSILHVPYKGSAPAITDLLGGQVPLLFDNISGSLPFIRNGKLKALGVTTATRSPLLPDTPTFAESGMDGYELTSWAGLFDQRDWRRFSSASVLTRWRCCANPRR